MARTLDFEDMNSQDWPEELTRLKWAARGAYTAYEELDTLQTAIIVADVDIPLERGAMLDLVGRAYALLRDLRAMGLRHLAAWEEANLVRLAANQLEWERKGEESEDEEN